MHTSSWIRFRLAHALQLFTALALGLTFMVIQGCGGPQKSAPESPSTTVQSPTPTGQVPRGARIPNLTPVPGSVVGVVLGGGEPTANATVTLWAASTGEPKQVGKHKLALMIDSSFVWLGVPTRYKSLSHCQGWRANSERSQGRQPRNRTDYGLG